MLQQAVKLLEVVLLLLSLLLSGGVQRYSGAASVLVVMHLLEVLVQVVLLQHLLLVKQMEILLALLFEVLLGTVAGLRHYRGLLSARLVVSLLLDHLIEHSLDLVKGLLGLLLVHLLGAGYLLGLVGLCTDLSQQLNGFIVGVVVVLRLRV